MKTDMNFFKRYKFAIAYITSVLVFIFTIHFIQASKIKKLYNAYPRLSLQDSISGRVNNIYSTHLVRHGNSVLVEIENIKVNIILSGVPYGSEIYKCIDLGDYLYKIANCDTVVLLEGKTLQVKYKYVLRE